MDYLNKMISKWMPLDSQRVAVDSHPRLSGIMDTMNSTLAHGPATRLPSEFYDRRFRTTIEKLGVEEWFAGFKESNEYRQVGIGSLVGDIVARMVGSAEGNVNDGILEVGGSPESPGIGRGGERSLKFALSGCHDTTLAALLASMGAFNDDRWPPYTSHIALELFRKDDTSRPEPKARPADLKSTNSAGDKSLSPWRFFFGSLTTKGGLGPAKSSDIGRRPLDEISSDERSRLDGFYVRMRYNDDPVTIPGCRTQGNHLEGDETFCTLVN